MIVPSPYPATLDDLARVNDKAELIGGRIVVAMPASRQHSRVGGWIQFSLKLYEVATGVGESHGDNLGYAMRPPLPSGRESFSPDVSYYMGRAQANPSKFIEDAPTFAVEVRSDGDYGPAAETNMADKRADYFLAGTLVVWDVDPVAETIACYRAADPAHPTIFHRGDTADAEPAVPGWRLSVDDVFRP